jgi:cytochrome c-type biogenesis protein CcmH
MPRGSAQAHQGYVLLGQAEASLGDWGQAALAWRRALDDGFDATLAAQTAEAQVRAEGGVSADSAALFRKALDAAPNDAPWRLLAEQRIAQSEHH